MKQYVVIAQDKGTFTFESRKNAKGFIKEMAKKHPGTVFAMTDIGDDDMEVRGG